MPVSYRISKISVLQFAIFPDKYKNSGKLELSTEILFEYAQVSKAIACIAKINYIEDDELLAIIQVRCEFSISDEGIKSIEEEKKISLFFLRYLATITVGTIRGILFSKTEGTTLNSLVLPPIDLTKIIKQDFILKQ